MRKIVVFVGVLEIVGAYKANAEGFLYSPLRTLNMTCDFCCYKTLKGKCHQAIDYDTTDDSSKILAAADGIVVELRDGMSTNRKGKKTDDYGNFIKVGHANGYQTIYTHLLKGTLLVSQESAVRAGMQLAIGDNSGWSSGSHLHFEVRDASGKKVNPYGDPPDYAGGCGPNALWATCPPVPYDSSHDDHDRDGYTIAGGDCNDDDRNINPGVQELCDDIDNNCDTQTDEDFPGLNTPCTVGLGECQMTGIGVCLESDLTKAFCSVAPKEPQNELCDNLDNDCDGQTDEDFPLGEPCTVGTGECQVTGMVVCATAIGQAVCSLAPLQPQPEVCDGKDNDCDGLTDEGCGPPSMTCDEVCSWQASCWLGFTGSYATGYINGCLEKGCPASVLESCAACLSGKSCQVARELCVYDCFT